VTQDSFTYQGSELEVFSKARNWKHYIRQVLSPYLGQQVLEVGAGNGATTAALCDGSQSRWLCLEPDAGLTAILKQKLADGVLPSCCEPRVGTLDQLSQAETLDTVLYIDVLEHIENDRSEVCRVVDLLAPGGHLIVLAPAHAWLYSEFDRAIGHYRRYTRPTLLDLSPPGLQPVFARYLDSAGLLASLANRILLREANPTDAQILVWDRLLVPISRILDKILLFSVGKSVVVIWRKST